MTGIPGVPVQSRVSRIAAATTVLTMLLGAPVAQAQHVVTEGEAGKLTLEALTATPPPPRPVYRAYYRPAMSVRYVHGRAVHARYAEAVSYRPARHVAHAAHHRRR